jgi:hypothetical protein
MMQQLTFGFMKELNEEANIELSGDVKSKLIKQMAIAIILVNHRGIENDDSTNK